MPSGADLVDCAHELLSGIALALDSRGFLSTYTRGGVETRSRHRTREQAEVLENGVASGLLGVALAFLELGRVTSDDSWLDRARAIAADAVGGYGRGLFDSAEGQVLVHHALGNDQLTTIPIDVSGSAGDVLNGEVGIAWLNLCLGRPSANIQFAVQSGMSRVGLGHGALGIEAVSLFSDSGPNTLSRKHETDLTGGGWCNGAAGLAAAYLLSHEASRDEHELWRGREAARRAAADTYASDGLCHGTFGVLAVSAGVARLCADAQLRELVLSRAAEMISQARSIGWRLERDRYADPTFLTGIAGIAWGLIAVLLEPVVNPLSPVDSEAWRKGIGTWRN